MRKLIVPALLGVTFALAACNAEAPSEESPVAPATICEDPAEDGSCPDFEEEVQTDANTDAESAVAD